MVKPALSASRAVAVVNLLTTNPHRPMTLTELCQALAVSPASLSAVLLALEESGYLIRHPRRRTYQLGPALIAAGHAASDQFPLVELARPLLRELAGGAVSECVASVAVGQEILIVAIEGAPSASTRDMWLGQRLPLSAPFGQVFVAWDADASIDRWVDPLADDADHAYATTTRALLTHVRECGYSLSLMTPQQAELDRAVADVGAHPMDESLRRRLRASVALHAEAYEVPELEADGSYDVATIAVPVFDPDGRVALAITAYGLIGVSGAVVEATIGQMRDAARRLMRMTGGRVPSDLLEHTP